MNEDQAPNVHVSCNSSYDVPCGDLQSTRHFLNYPNLPGFENFYPKGKKDGARPSKSEAGSGEFLPESNNGRV